MNTYQISVIVLILLYFYESRKQLLQNSSLIARGSISYIDDYINNVYQIQS